MTSISATARRESIPGNATWHFVNTPKVVSGIDKESLEAVQAFFDRLVDRTVPVSGTREAELTKLLENTFRHVNIALVNELAMFAEAMGIDVWEAIDAASTKPFGYLRFTPGPGVGGHCLPIDPSYLSWKVRRSVGQPFRFVELANDINAAHARLRRVPADAGPQPGQALGQRLPGAAAGTGLQAEHGGHPRVPRHGHRPEPLGTRRGGQGRRPARAARSHRRSIQVELTADEVQRADAVVVVTDHDDFDYDMVRDRARYVLDTRNRISGPQVESL